MFSFRSHKSARTEKTLLVCALHNLSFPFYEFIIPSSLMYFWWPNICPKNVSDFLSKARVNKETLIAFSFTPTIEFSLYLSGPKLPVAEDFNIAQHVHQKCFQFSHICWWKLENINTFFFIHPTEVSLHLTHLIFVQQRTLIGCNIFQNSVCV